MNAGCITEIQRFSLNDGPGLRATVFCKGCNMRCSWCHNPETIDLRPELQFFESKCICCGGCRPGEDTVEADPRTCLMDASGKLRHYRGNCQAGALVQVGRMVTPEDVLAEVLEDENFYRNSGGGVTLSGGEVTIQTEFACDTLKLCKEEGIHTAIETNIATPWARIEKLLPVLDLVMFDIKSMNEAKHREWTGVGLQRILENADRLNESEVPLIIRTPVIPEFNDTVEDLVAIAGRIARYRNLEYYELLPFNPLGADKYKCMGKAYRMENARMIRDETMKTLQNAAQASGIKVRIG